MRGELRERVSGSTSPIPIIMFGEQIPTLASLVRDDIVSLVRDDIVSLVRDDIVAVTNG
jgi:hypothetical protein